MIYPWKDKVSCGKLKGTDQVTRLGFLWTNAMSDEYNREFCFVVIVKFLLSIRSNFEDFYIQDRDPIVMNILGWQLSNCGFQLKLMMT